MDETCFCLFCRTGNFPDASGIIYPDSAAPILSQCGEGFFQSCSVHSLDSVPGPFVQVLSIAPAFLAAGGRCLRWRELPDTFYLSARFYPVEGRGRLD